MVDKVRGRVVQIVGRPFRYFEAEWDRMAARERRSITILAIAVVVVALSLVVYLVLGRISDLEETNADVREALTAIAKNRDSYLEAKARAQAQETRLGTDPPIVGIGAVQDFVEQEQHRPPAVSQRDHVADLQDLRVEAHARRHVANVDGLVIETEGRGHWASRPGCG